MLLQCEVLLELLPEIAEEAKAIVFSDVLNGETGKIVAVGKVYHKMMLLRTDLEESATSDTNKSLTLNG